MYELSIWRSSHTAVYRGPRAVSHCALSQCAVCRLQCSVFRVLYTVKPPPLAVVVEAGAGAGREENPADHAGPVLQDPGEGGGQGRGRAVPHTHSLNKSPSRSVRKRHRDPSS